MLALDDMFLLTRWHKLHGGTKTYQQLMSPLSENANRPSYLRKWGMFVASDYLQLPSTVKQNNWILLHCIVHVIQYTEWTQDQWHAQRVQHRHSLAPKIILQTQNRWAAQMTSLISATTDGQMPMQHCKCQATTPIASLKPLTLSAWWLTAMCNTKCLQWSRHNAILTCSIADQNNQYNQVLWCNSIVWASFWRKTPKSHNT